MKKLDGILLEVQNDMGLEGFHVSKAELLAVKKQLRESNNLQKIEDLVKSNKNPKLLLKAVRKAFPS